MGKIEELPNSHDQPPAEQQSKLATFRQKLLGKWLKRNDHNDDERPPGPGKGEPESPVQHIDRSLPNIFNGLP